MKVFVNMQCRIY